MKQTRVIAGAATGALLAGATLAGRALFDRRTVLPSDPSLYTAEAADSPVGQLRVRFMGVSTLLFTDGQTSILCDGFFSRPSKARILTTRIGPDQHVIESCLQRAGISSLAAVLVAHSHYDHALDSAAVAQRTGAQLVGSESTVNIGRGAGLPESQMTRAIAHHPWQFGPYTVTFVESEHSPRGKFPGSVTAPLRPPARMGDYKMAECYSMIIKHAPAGGPDHVVLVHASAGYRTGMLTGYSADVAFLGTTLLSKQDEQFRREYWHETVQEVGARRVLPIHWDDFTKPLTQPLVPMPNVIDDFGGALEFLAQNCERDGIDYQIPRTWIVIDPFAGLPEAPAT